MWIESRIKPNAKNPTSSAVGLIQFMPATLQPWGYTTAQVQAMSASKQLDLVERYLKPYIGKLSNFLDLYLAVFFPDALGKDDAYVLPSKVAKYNPAFKDENGEVTVSSIKNKLAALLPDAAKSLIYVYSIPLGLLSLIGIYLYFRKTK